MHDPTEDIRRKEAVAINADPMSREALEDKYGAVFSTQELRGTFEVLGFAAPFVVVRRRSDGVVGSLKFQHDPRLYFAFRED